MRKIEREYIKLCRQEGVELLEIGQSRSHYQLHFERGILNCAGTPSDRRNKKNFRAKIRRFAD